MAADSFHLNKPMLHQFQKPLIGHNFFEGLISSKFFFFFFFLVCQSLGIVFCILVYHLFAFLKFTAHRIPFSNELLVDFSFFKVNIPEALVYKYL